MLTTIHLTHSRGEESLQVLLFTLPNGFRAFAAIPRSVTGDRDELRHLLKILMLLLGVNHFISIAVSDLAKM